jgi:hypothetical protein
MTSLLQGVKESRPLVRITFGPDAGTVATDDPFHGGQAEAVSFDGCPAKSLEGSEQLP